MLELGQYERFKLLILSPAAPLAIYFCISTMLAVLASHLGFEHPAYWIFGYLAVCMAWAIPRVQFKVHAADLAFLLFSAVVLASWMATGYTGGHRAAFYFLSSAMLPWAAVRLFSESDIARFLKFVALFGAAVCVAYIVLVPFLQPLDVGARATFEGGTVYGIFGPTVGLLAVMSGIYLIRKSLMVAWVALTVSVFVVVHMGGRGMYLSIVLTLLLACTAFDSPWRRKALILAVVLASTLVAFVEIPGLRLAHFLSALHLVPHDTSLNDTIMERLLLFRAAFEMFLAHPLAGVGVGRFALESGLSSAWTTPHSTLFHVLSELGVAGIIPFLFLNVALVRLALRARRGDAMTGVAAAAWLYFLIYDQISANYLTSLRFYLFAGLLVSASLVSDQRSSASASAPRAM